MANDVQYLIFGRVPNRWNRNKETHLSEIKKMIYKMHEVIHAKKKKQTNACHLFQIILLER